MPHCTACRRSEIQILIALIEVEAKMVLTRDAMIVQSSHQNGAAEIFLAKNRAATAIVAATTLTTLPNHTFHAKLSLGGKDMVVMVSSK